MKEKIKNIQKKLFNPILIVIILSILLAVISDVYLLILEDKIQVFLANILANISVARILILSIIYMTIGLIIHIFKNELYKFRYYIVLGILVVCVTFEISGSSIGNFSGYFNGIKDENGIILGVSRLIRTDEWAVNTPFAFSQEYDKNPYSYENSTIRGTDTDVFIVYGQPIDSPLMVYRIFQIGYLIFGATRGLSFFWCARLLALFIVSFELMMLITKKDKRLSFIGAIMITLAPIVQWWFAINGLVELFVSGSLAILLLNKYMKDDRFLHRCLYVLGLIVCAGTYILVFYPAWQIPLAYVFLVLAIWIIMENIKGFRISKKDIFTIIIGILILGLSLGYVIIKSYDTISTTVNTVYPGNKIARGGDGILRYFNYPANIFFSLDSRNINNSNVCEQSVFFDLFPIGLILSIYILIKSKKKDKLLLGLCALSIFFGIWSIIGYPEIIEKIALLSRTTTKRAYLAVGFANIIMLIRALSLMEKGFNKKIAALISILVAIIVIGFTKVNFSDYLETGKKIYVILPILCIMFFFALKYKDKYFDKLFTFSIAILFLFMSLLINPIRTSADFIYNSPLIKEVKNINESDKGLWVIAYESFPKNNLLIMAGIPTINSTNVYPTMDRWKELDVDGKYEDVYNRYAHISIIIDDNAQKPIFRLLYPDQFELTISSKDLYEKLNVKYVFTGRSIDDYSEDNITVKKIYNNYEYNVYKLEKAQ